MSELTGATLHLFPGSHKHFLTLSSAKDRQIEFHCDFTDVDQIVELDRNVSQCKFMPHIMFSYVCKLENSPVCLANITLEYLPNNKPYVNAHRENII